MTGICATLFAVFTAIWPLVHWGHPDAFAENGAVEGLQSIYLAATVILMLYAARDPGPLKRLALSGIALFTFNLLVRETDVRGTVLEPLLGPVFLHGRFFYYLAGLWTAIVAMVSLDIPSIARDLLRWLRGPAGMAMVAGCLLYGVAHIAEKHRIYSDEPRSEALEETLELYGCFAILGSGWLTATRANRGARL